MDADAPPAILVEYAVCRRIRGDGMTTLSDVLNATKPPLELLDHLTRYQGCAALPDQVVGWLERWLHLCRRTGSAADALTDEPMKGE